MKKYFKLCKHKWLVIGYTLIIPNNKKKYFIRIKDDRKDIASC